MKTVHKMPKYMDFKEALNCAIQKLKLIQRRIDDTSDEEAGSEDGEESDSSYCSKTDSDPKSDPDGRNIPLDVWSEFYYNIESRGLTLKEKETLKLFYNAVRFCRDWENEPTYTKVMDTVENTQLRNGMDFRESLCYGIEQWKFLLWRKIEMDDDTSDDAAVVEADIKMEPTTKKPRGSDPIDYL